MAKLHMLFVDDDEESIKPAMTWASTNYDCRCVSFPGYEEALEEHQPHIAIVDRMAGVPPTGTDEGRPVFNRIWDHRFCPVIIYSAFKEVGEDARMTHPLVRHVAKGLELKPFTDAVEELSSHAEAINAAERHIRQQFAFALRDVAPYVASAFPEPKERGEVITRHARRRLAALMDEMSLGVLASWEQYIHPPVSKDLLLGDVLRRKNGSPDDPQTFRIVLTPSCDLPASGGRKPKVDRVLVARCCPAKQAVASTDLCRYSGDRLRTTLISAMLNRGSHEKLVPFPLLKGKIPTMMADLKELDLVPFEEIMPPASSKYERVASLDSPFRELISWAYLQTGCRPGLPDRNVEAWSKEIMEAIEPGVKKT